MLVHNVFFLKRYWPLLTVPKPCNLKVYLFSRMSVCSKYKVAILVPQTRWKTFASISLFGCQAVSFLKICSSNRLENLNICLNIAPCCLLESLHMGCLAVTGQILLIRQKLLSYDEGKYSELFIINLSSENEWQQRSHEWPKSHSCRDSDLPLASHFVCCIFLFFYLIYLLFDCWICFENE